MWMRQMTLGQIDPKGNGFHKAPDGFIISHTIETVEAQTFIHIVQCPGTWEEIILSDLNDELKECVLIKHLDLKMLFHILITSKILVCKITVLVRLLDCSLKQCSQHCVSITSLMKNEDVLGKKCVSLRCRSQMNIHPAHECCSLWACGTK